MRWRIECYPQHYRGWGISRSRLFKGIFLRLGSYFLFIGRD